MDTALRLVSEIDVHPKLDGFHRFKQQMDALHRFKQHLRFDGLNTFHIVRLVISISHGILD